MVESDSTQGNNTSREITIEAITTGVSSVKEASRQVEAARLSLYYLLAKGRTLDSLLLLQQIDAKSLPFNPGERDKMFNGILKTAEGLRKEDPIEAWNTIWDITYSKARQAPYHESRDFTREEYEKLNTQEFKDQQAATLGRFIECYLNPDIKIKGRERFAREDLSSHMNDTTSLLYHLDFDKVFNSLDEATREKLLAIDRDHPLNVLKRKLQAGGETARPPEKTAEKTEEIGKISDFTDALVRWQHENYEIYIRKEDNVLVVFFDVNDELVGIRRLLSSKDFDLATVIEDFKNIEPDTAEKIYQSLAKRFSDGLKKKEQISLDLLEKFPGIIFTDDGTGRTVIRVSKSGLSAALIYELFGKTMSEDDIKKLDPRVISTLNVNIGKVLLGTWIKSSPAPTPPIGIIPEPEGNQLLIQQPESARVSEGQVNKLVIEEAVEGNKLAKRLKVNGKVFGFVSNTSHKEGHFRFVLEEDMPENYLNIPKGMEVYFSIRVAPNADINFGWKGVSIMGGEGAKLNLKELYSLGILASNPPFIGILTPEYEGWNKRVDKTAGRAGQAVIYDSDLPYATPYLPVNGLWMSMDELGNFLKTRKEEIENKKAAGENVVSPEVPELGEIARPSLDQTNATESEKTERGKSIFSKIRFGQYKVPEASRKQETDPVKNFIKEVMGEDPRKYKISYSAVRKKDLGKAEVNMVYFNNYGKFKRFLRGLTPEQLEKMKTYRYIDYEGVRYPSLNVSVSRNFWNKVNSNPEFKKAMKESGLFDRIRFGEFEFEKLPEEETAKPPTATEMLESQVPVKEPKAKVEVIPISERDDFSDRSVKLRIGGRESGIVWDQPKDGREPRKGDFHLRELRKEKGKLMLPNGTRLYISKYLSESNVVVAILITGGGNTAIDIPDLIYFKDRDLNITLLTNDSESWAILSEGFYEENGVYEERGKCIFTHSPGFIIDKEKTIHGLSVKDAVALLKESLETAKT